MLFLACLAVLSAICFAVAVIACRHWRARYEAFSASSKANVIRLEQALEEETEKFAALMDGLDAAGFVVDATGRINYANPVAVEMFDAVPSPLTGKTLLEATLSPDIEQALESEERRHVSRLAFESSGRRYRAVVIANATRNGSGLVMITDETKLVHLETARRDFVANVSHELRTPLASIRAMAEALLDVGIDDVTTARKFLKTIIKESDRLTRVANDLLILSHAESREPERKKTDVAEIVAEVAQEYERQAREAGIDLRLEVAEGLFVLADRDQLHHAFGNLVDNAIKYTREGGVVTLRACRSNGKARVFVVDTGIGIMQEHLPRIFERFYRVDEARSRDSGGTGLGLSIVKHMVEANGGSVSVQSEFNRGTTFAVTLPMMEDSS